MRSNGKLLYFSVLMVTIVIAMAAISSVFFNRLQILLDDQFTRSDLDQRDAEVATQIREIHLNYYKALSWSSSGYDGKKVAELLKAQGSAIDGLTATLQQLKTVFSKDKSSKAEAVDNALRSLAEYKKWAVQVADMATADTATATVFMGSAETAYQKLNEQLKTFIDQNKTESKAARENAQHSLKFFFNLMVVVIVIMLVSVCGITLSLHRTVTLPIRRAINGLSQTSQEISAASLQVSDASQRLAESASQQAAAVQETSASLAEISSMTGQNAEHATEAASLANKARQSVETGLTEMRSTRQAMEEICSASENIAGVLKAIDAIAFQTNLLALNAAIEAARAGESGLGFAVVAGEVKDLAQRSAQAARETSARLEETIAKSRLGADLNATVSRRLDEISDCVLKLNTLVGQIAEASHDQNRGLKQIDSAVSNIDKVIQTNAASAEEGASSSAELDTQARQLLDAVSNLRSLVGGTTDSAPEPADTKSAKPPTHSDCQTSAHRQEATDPIPNLTPTRPLKQTIASRT